MAAVRERLRPYATSHPHPATPRNVAGTAQAIKVAAPAPALAAPVATAQTVPFAVAAQPVLHVAGVAASASASAIGSELLLRLSAE